MRIAQSLPLLPYPGSVPGQDALSRRPLVGEGSQGFPATSSLAGETPTSHWHRRTRRREHKRSSLGGGPGSPRACDFSAHQSTISQTTPVCAPSSFQEGMEHTLGRHREWLAPSDPHPSALWAFLRGLAVAPVGGVAADCPIFDVVPPEVVTLGICRRLSPAGSESKLSGVSRVALRPRVCRGHGGPLASYVPAYAQGAASREVTPFAPRGPSRNRVGGSLFGTGLFMPDMMRNTL